MQELISHAARQPEALLDAPGDPRVGMTRACYGGGIQLVVAGLDNRAGPPLVATGSGTLPPAPGPGEGAAIAATRSVNAVNVAIPPPSAAVPLVGAPKLTLTYSGAGAPADSRVYAQIVDDATGIVLGNQVTPIPITLDGAPHTIARPLEMVSALAKPGSGLTLQLYSASSVHDLGRTAGAVTFSSVRLVLPTADPAKAPPGYPSAVPATRRRAGLRIAAVGSVARRRVRMLGVTVRTVNGTVRNVVRIRGRRGAVKGASRPRRTFSGRRRLVVRLRRNLAPGRYVIEAAGRRPDGTRVRVTKRLVKPAPR